MSRRVSKKTSCAHCGHKALLPISFELLKFRVDLFKWISVEKIGEVSKTVFHIVVDCLSCHLRAENVDGSR